MFYTVVVYPLYTIIEVIYVLVLKLLHNTGIAVIGVSMAISLLCLPLYAVAENWQEKERETQNRMKDGLARIKKAFSGNERYMMTTTYYRQHHYNPIMALRSSFGLLIQIPFFIAGYTFLSHLPDLQGTPFACIRDLGAPDGLFHIGTLSVNVLPIAMTLINGVSGLIYSRGHGIREKIQIFGMAALFLLILYDSPSGLVLYWTCNNLFSLVKNVFYKLRHPLRTLYIVSCAFLTVSAVFIVGFFTTKAVYKLLFVFFVLAVYALPLLLRGVRRMLASPTGTRIQNEQKNRTLLFIACCVLLWLLAGLTIPSSLIASSPAEFSGLAHLPNPLSFIRIVCVQAVGFCLFWPLCIYFLFGNKKVQTVFVCIASFLAISALVNAFCFMLSYGDVSATLTFLNAVDFRTASPLSLVNAAALVALGIVLALAVRWLGLRMLFSLHVIAAVALFVFSCGNLVGIQREYTQLSAKGTLSQTDITPIFHLSKTAQNVVVFMLDRAESQFVTSLFAEDPTFFDTFSGFTFYPNTVSFNGNTMIGAPLVYGGYEYAPLEMNRRADELLYKKNNEAILLLPRIFTEQSNFHATITDPSWANYSGYADLSITDPYERIDGYQTIAKYSEAWYKTRTDADDLNNSDTLLTHHLFFFSLFRSSPIFLRELVYLKGKYWFSDDTETSYTNVINNYAALEFLPQLTDFSESDTGAYICMVNELTHSSVYLQAPDYVPKQHVTTYSSSRFAQTEAYYTNMAAFKLLARWITLLKENGVYDNTRIILVSDHSRTGHEDDMEADDTLDRAIGRGHYHPLLMEKDFYATGTLKTDQTFMTNGDVPSLALRGIVAQPVNPFTGNPVPLDTTPLKKDGIVMTVNSVHQAWLLKHLYTYPVRNDEWWRVKDNVFAAQSWSREQMN